MLKSALYTGGKGYNEYLKYFIEDLKVPINNNFLFEVCICACCNHKMDFEMLKFLIEEKICNPKIKNNKNENLLFVVIHNLNRYSSATIEEKVFPVIDYLITKCKLDINEKNIYNETVLCKLLSTDCFDSTETEENKYKTADYLLKNYKVKLDTNSKILLQKNFIPFLKCIYKRS